MIYRRGKDGEWEEVRGPDFVCESGLTADQVKLDPSMDVSDRHTSLCCPLTMTFDMVPAGRTHH